MIIIIIIIIINNNNFNTYNNNNYRVAAKCANNFVLPSLGNKLLPTQLGLGSSGYCKVAVCNQTVFQ